MVDEQKPVQITKAQAAANVVNMLHDVAEQAADDQDHGALIQILRTLQQKPGVRTTEFWLAFMLNCIGFGFQFWPGHEVIGGTIMLGASSIYTLARMVVKTAESKAVVIPVTTRPA